MPPRARADEMTVTTRVIHPRTHQPTTIVQITTHPYTGPDRLGPIWDADYYWRLFFDDGPTVVLPFYAGLALPAADYAAAVIQTLAEEFADLRDPHTAALITSALTQHALTPDPALEIIIDSRHGGCWRLHADPNDGSRVRLRCHPHPATAHDVQREQRLNALLRQP